MTVLHEEHAASAVLHSGERNVRISTCEAARFGQGRISWNVQVGKKSHARQFHGAEADAATLSPQGGQGRMITLKQLRKDLLNQRQH
jgi:hypothetical protein